MTMWTLLTISLLMNLMMPTMYHPLSLILLIIIQTIITCLLMSIISYSFWFSYIMILIFLGGMLVLFIYITSLASNETFTMSSKTMMMLIPLSFMMSISIFMLSSNMNSNLPNKNDSFTTNNIYMSTENPSNLIQFYNYPISTLTILTVIYLLITMIVVVKITKVQEGPLRQMN